MAYLTKMKLNGVSYDIRDAEAYKAINILNGDSGIAGSVANSIKNALANLKNTSFRVVDELPNADEAEDGVIYLVTEVGIKSGSYVEYIKVSDIEGNYSMEKIGTTDVDLSDYQNRTDATEIAKRILEINEFVETDDLLTKDGYSYITIHEDGVAEIGINRQENSTVYVRENIVYQSELAALQKEVDLFKDKEEQDVKVINTRIDNEVETINQQTGISSYVTIEMEGENVGTIDVVDVSVLQPKSTRLSVDTSWYNDKEDTFMLDTPDQILGLSRLLESGETTFENKTISLESDINLLGQEFTPIGLVETQNPSIAIYHVQNVGTKVFKGTFDGKGHTISNLRISQSVGNGWDNTGIGLFGIVENGATIKNVTINNVDIQSTTSNMVGAIIGYIPNTNNGKETIIENCTVMGRININGRLGVGAIIGRSEIGTKVIIRNCSVVGNDKNTSIITASIKNLFAGVGGIAGAIYGERDNIVENCIVKNVTITSSNEGNGGLVGHFDRGTIRNNVLNNVTIADTMNTTVYMQEAVAVGAIAGTVDSTIKSTSGNVNINLDKNTFINVEVHIPSTYTNGGNASGVELDSNGVPNWLSWSVIGTPRNVEHIDPTPYVNSTDSWSEMRKNIAIIKD